MQTMILLLFNYNGSKHELFVIVVLLIWKYYERIVIKSILSIYDSNMYLAKHLFGFMMKSYCLENLNYLNRIDYTQWIQYCVDHIFETKFSLQQWFYEEIIKNDGNEKHTQILKECILKSTNFRSKLETSSVEHWSYYSYYSLIAYFMHIHNGELKRTLPIQIKRQIVRQSVIKHNFELFKAGINCLNDEQLNDKQCILPRFNYEYKWERNEIMFRFFGEYLNYLLINSENNSDNDAVDKMIKMLKRNVDDNNELNQLFISSARYGQQQLFIKLTQNKHIKRDKNNFKIIRDLFYVNNKKIRSKEMKQAFSIWSGASKCDSWQNKERLIGKRNIKTMCHQYIYHLNQVEIDEIKELKENEILRLCRTHNVDIDNRKQEKRNELYDYYGKFKYIYTANDKLIDILINLKRKIDRENNIQSLDDVNDKNEIIKYKRETLMRLCREHSIPSIRKTSELVQLLQNEYVNRSDQEDCDMTAP